MDAVGNQAERKRKPSSGEKIRSSPPAKKLNDSLGNKNGEKEIHVSETKEQIEKVENSQFESFEGFTLKNILSNSADHKRIVLEASLNNQSAVIILDKKPFSEDVIQELLSSESKLRRTFQNDIYGSYDCVSTDKASEIKTTVVFPATKKHIDKYIHHKLFLVEETPEIYEKVTLPYLEESSFNIQWVFNILDHKKEEDRIAYEDSDAETGFILLPDLKWDGVAVQNLYLVAIVHAKGIKSLRDLRGEHLVLLENILERGTTAIKDKYGLSRSELRVYIHYQPSYYHLHVHFTALQFNAPGIYPEKSHLLPTVIGNIKANPSFYQEATLPFVVKENETHYNKLVQYGYKF